MDKTNLSDLIDFEKIDTLLEGFNKSTGFVTAILDIKGNVLSKSGWRQICTEFHRIHPETSKKCTISDTELANKMAEGERYHFYKCLNGLVDVAVPIVIKGEHIANLFSGQFFFEEPDISFFKKQATEFGFDEGRYLEALEKVPVVSKEKVKTAMDFLLDMTQLISDTTFQKLEQKELNKNIIVSEERFTKAFHSSPIAITITSKSSGKYIDVNNSWCGIYGYTAEEAIGHTPVELGIIDAEARIQISEELKTKGTLKNVDMLLRNKSGEYRTILFSSENIEVGGEPCVLSTGIDVTVRKQAEEKLTESVEKFKSVFESANVGKSITLPTGEINVNQAFCDMLGYTREELQNKKWQDLTPDDEIPTIQAFTNPMLKGEKESARFEKRYICKNGTHIWADVSVSIRRDKNGKPLHFITTVIDITERKQVEKKLTESENDYRSLFENMNAGFELFEVVQNEQGIPVDLLILAANEGFEKTTGLKLRDSIGKRLTQVLPGIEKDEADWIGTFSKVALSGESAQFEQGSELLGYYYSISAFQAGPKQCAVTFMDITEQNNTTIALQKSEERFRVAQEYSPDGFTILHPLRNEQNEIVDFVWIYQNQAIAQINGTEDQDVIGKRVLDVFPTHKGTDIFETYIEVANAGKSKILDDVYVGEVISEPTWLRLVITAMGQDIAILAQNVTDRKKAEEAIRISRERLLLATEGANLGVWNWNIVTGELIWSNKSKDLFGLEHDVIMSYERFIDGLHPDDRERTNEAVKDSLENHKDFDLEYRTIWPDGSNHWIGAKGRGFYDENGNAVRMEGVLIDISERKQAEEFDRESAERIKMQRNLIAKLSFEDVIVNKPIDEALKILTTQLAEILKVERTSVWLLSDDDKLLKRRMFFDFASGIDSQVEVLNAAEFPSYFKALYKDSQIDADDAQNDPRTKELNESYFIPLQISSMLDSAIHQNGRVIGVLSAEHRGPVRKWHPDEKSLSLSLTNLVSQLFANTERKKAEEKIREKDIQFRKLSANLPDLIFQFTRRPDGTYCVPIASEGIKNIFGCSPEDVVDNFAPIGKVIYPDDAERVINDIEYSAKHLTYFTCEFRVQIPGKEIQWILSRSTPEKLPDGSITWYGFNADITERKKLEVERYKFFMLAESSSEFIGMCDLEMNPLYVNPAGRRMVGLPDMEAACRVKVQDYYFPEDQKFIAEDFFPNVLREGHGDVEIRLRNFQTGEAIWMYYYLFSVQDDSGTPIGWATVSRNITERRRAEEEIKKQLNELQRWQEVTIGREDRNMQLKSEVNELLNRLGEPIRYPSQAGGSDKRETGKDE
ncbi:MAG: PAS domain S-box protein [Melioribacteraceae bacterium]|nr:PAS domain S-box protein [Melioribacteraceae bacterium]MCF8396167.1 PAS domain S-box protein [Melioribacteraceae bacterium]MCF8421223.1 PAS domain S-box protein [Melioribacteraceae bacterium]